VLGLLLQLAVAEPGRVVVHLEQGVFPADVGITARPLAPPSRHRHPSFSALGLDRVWVIDTDDAAALDASLGGRAGVARAYVDGRGRSAGVPSDPLFHQQWGLRNDGTFTSGSVSGADIQAVDAWDVETGRDIVVAVLDTGLSLGEPDIAVWLNTGEVAGNGVDDDGNGYIDDTNGYDLAYRDETPSDLLGHGSNVAGIAAALGDNGIGYTGVCQACEVMPLQVLNNDNWGYYTDWAEGVVYAVDNGAHVINMSLAGTDVAGALCDAVAYATAAGVPVVICMGNTDDGTLMYPAACDEGIEVGATDFADQRASPFVWGGGSNYGDHIDVMAPGDLIYGLDAVPGQYDFFWSGTSQATPLVAGLVALMLSRDPDLSPAEVRALLHDGAEDQVGRADEDTPGFDRYHGYGRVNASHTLDLMRWDEDEDGDGISVGDGDCDDDDDGVYPGADEVCNGVDDDCDGAADEGALDPRTWYADADGDGEGDPAVTTQACAQPSGYVDNADDCDDTRTDECRGGCGCAVSSMPNGAGGLIFVLGMLVAYRRRCGEPSGASSSPANRSSHQPDPPHGASRRAGAATRFLVVIRRCVGVGVGVGVAGVLLGGAVGDQYAVVPHVVDAGLASRTVEQIVVAGAVAHTLAALVDRAVAVVVEAVAVLLQVGQFLVDLSVAVVVDPVALLGRDFA
jgi:MYXO-CTERM domain-containing protein